MGMTIGFASEPTEAAGIEREQRQDGDTEEEISQIEHKNLQPQRMEARSARHQVSMRIGVARHQESIRRADLMGCREIDRGGDM
jgi:hypothetical protein